jgi:hypothetical protein
MQERPGRCVVSWVSGDGAPLVQKSQELTQLIITMCIRFMTCFKQSSLTLGNLLTACFVVIWVLFPLTQSPSPGGELLVGFQGSKSTTIRASESDIQPGK